MARSLHLSFICIPQSTRALDQGGVEPRQAVSPKALRPWTMPRRYSVGCTQRGELHICHSFIEILGAQTMLLTWTSPLIAIALQEGTSIVYPILWRRQIQLCLNTVRNVECHLSQESSPFGACLPLAASH